MNTDNRKEDLQCIVLGFVLHAVVIENDHGIGMSFSSRTCALLRLFFEKRVRVVFGSKDFSPKTHLLGKKIRWPASITYNRPLGVVKLNCRFCTLLKASEPFFDRFLAAATRVVDCWSLFVMNNNAFDVARYILSSAVN